MSEIKRGIWRFGRKSKTFRKVIRFTVGNPIWNTNDMADFFGEGYKGNPYVYAAINALADSVAGPPPVLYRVREKGRVERALELAYDVKASVNCTSKKGWSKETCVRNLIQKSAAWHIRRTGMNPFVAKQLAVKQLAFSGELELIEAHPVLDLLARPNGFYQSSYKEYVTAYVVSLMGGGEVFEEPCGEGGTVEGGGTFPSELYILPANQMTQMDPTEDSPLPGFEYGGWRETNYLYSPDPLETEIFFSKLYDPLNPIRGLSPLSAASRSVDLNNEARKYNLKFMQNGGVIGGLVTGEFTPEQAQALEDGWDEQQAGAENAGRIMAVGGEDVKYHITSIDSAKLLWAETLTMTARETSIVFNVPPEIIGDSANKTHANYNTARLALHQDAGLPLADGMFGNWNSGWLKLFGDDLFLDYDTDQVLAIQEDVNKAYERIDKASFLTLNEKRVSVGWEPIEGGDVIMVPSTVMPLEAALVLGSEDIQKAFAHQPGVLDSGFPEGLLIGPSSNGKSNV